MIIVTSKKFVSETMQCERPKLKRKLKVFKRFAGTDDIYGGQRSKDDTSPQVSEL